jgi:hypothetical protein
MGKIPSSDNFTSATENGLSAAGVRDYHTMLRSVFERAQRDRVVTCSPCARTKLPKVAKKRARTLSPEEYVAIVPSLPAQHRYQHTPPRHRERALPLGRMLISIRMQPCCVNAPDHRQENCD